MSSRARRLALAALLSLSLVPASVAQRGPVIPVPRRPSAPAGEMCPPGQVVVGFTLEGHIVCAPPPCVPCGSNDPCLLPIDPGPCRAAIPRWGFDASAGECVEFTYGGCGGNANNFETEAECATACEPSPCHLPPDAGPCTAVVPRWYHDVASGQCQPFTYGGCGGNANNFETEAECEAACELGPCHLPPDPGPCDAVIPRWYFDPATGACQPFTYGGCGGNENNFETQAECEAACLG